MGGCVVGFRDALNLLSYLAQRQQEILKSNTGLHYLCLNVCLNHRMEAAQQ